MPIFLGWWIGNRMPVPVTGFLELLCDARGVFICNESTLLLSSDTLDCFCTVLLALFDVWCWRLFCCWTDIVDDGVVAADDNEPLPILLWSSLLLPADDCDVGFVLILLSLSLMLLLFWTLLALDSVSDEFDGCAAVSFNGSDIVIVVELGFGFCADGVCDCCNSDWNCCVCKSTVSSGILIGGISGFSIFAVGFTFCDVSWGSGAEANGMFSCTFCVGFSIGAGVEEFDSSTISGKFSVLVSGKLLFYYYNYKILVSSDLFKIIKNLVVANFSKEEN